MCMSPTLLFLTGCTVLGWALYHVRYYEKLGIPEVYFLRSVGALSFLYLCLVGPVALAWCFGVGGSAALAHAALRNPAAHKDDDAGAAGDDPEVGAAGDEKRFHSCDDEADAEGARNR